MPLRAVASRAFTVAVLPKDAPVPVLFTADWCGPCRAFEPVFRAKAEAVGREFLVVDVTNRLDPIWQDLGLRNVPAVAVFKGADVVAAVHGPLGEAELDDVLRRGGIL